MSQALVGQNVDRRSMSIVMAITTVVANWI
jgi:hypothetical protein